MADEPKEKKVMVVVNGHTDPTTGRILFTQALKAFKIGEILSKNGFKGFSPRIYVPPDMPVAMDTAYGIVMGLGGIKHVQISNRTGPRAPIQRLPFIAWDAHPGEIQLVIEDADNARGMVCVQQTTVYMAMPLSIMLYTYQSGESKELKDLRLMDVEQLRFNLD